MIVYTVGDSFQAEINVSVKVAGSASFRQVNSKGKGSKSATFQRKAF